MGRPRVGNDRTVDQRSDGLIAMTRWTEREAGRLRRLLSPPALQTFGGAIVAELRRMVRFQPGQLVRAASVKELNKFHKDAKESLRGAKKYLKGTDHGPDQTM